MTRPAALTRRELGLWQAWQSAAEAIGSRVAREVAEATGLSAAEYAVLARLIEAAGGHLRQRELAVALGWDKSRISHQLTRMQERHLLARSKTAEYGSRVAVTRSGREAFSRAQPIHAAAVRRHFIRRLTPEQAATVLSLTHPLE